MYYEMIIFTDDIQSSERPQRNSRQARAMMAEACDGFPVNPAIFSRDADGKTLQTLVRDTASGETYGAAPHVFFGGGNGLIRVTGLGVTGTDLVRDNAMLMLTAISQLVGHPCQFRAAQGQASLQRSYPHLYHVADLSLCKGGQVAKYMDPKAGTMTGKDGKEKGMATLESCRPLILKAIRSGLISQAHVLDEQDGGNRLSQIGTDDELGIEILQGYPYIDRREDKGGQIFLNMRHLVFSVDLELAGPWLIGRLRSQGLGLVRPHRVIQKQNPRQEEAAKNVAMNTAEIA